MAIIIEEQRNPSRIFGLVGWAAFVLAIGIAAYYIFLTPVPEMPIAATGTLMQIAPLVNASVKPQDLVNNPVLHSFHTTIPMPSPQGPALVMRTNPFISY